jgi:hypothetical protein
MRIVAKPAGEPHIMDDPRPKDRAMWNRLRVVVEHEASHRDWGCALYTLHRTGRISNDQREAGDKFVKIATDYKRLIKEPITDVLGLSGQFGGLSIHQQTKHIGSTRDMIASAWADNLRDSTELETRRDERTTRRYKEVAAIAGSALSILESLVLDDIWPVGDRGHIEISHALTRLSHFFNTGTKRKR